MYIFNIRHRDECIDLYVSRLSYAAGRHILVVDFVVVVVDVRSTSLEFWRHCTAEEGTLKNVRSRIIAEFISKTNKLCTARGSIETALLAFAGFPHNSLSNRVLDRVMHFVKSIMSHSSYFI